MGAAPVGGGGRAHAVLRPEVPFARAARRFTDELVVQGFAPPATRLGPVFKWYPAPRSHRRSSRMLDLDEADGRRIDMVIGTKFRLPSFAIGRSASGSVHQFRRRTRSSRHRARQFGEHAECVRRQVLRSSTGSRSARGRGSLRPRENVADRLERSTGLVAEVLPHPPEALPYRTAASEGFVLSEPSDPAKRIDLLLEGASSTGSRSNRVDGPDRERLERRAREKGLDGRVRFEGRVSAERLAELYVSCASASRADRTRTSSRTRRSSPGTKRDHDGTVGPLDDAETGLVVEPTAAARRPAAAWLRAHDDEAAAFGRAGKGCSPRGDVGPAIGRLLA